MKLKSNLIYNIHTVFHHGASRDIFTTLKTVKQLSFLSCLIEYDEHDSRVERWKKDNFACFQEFLEYIHKIFFLDRRPSEHLATDETLCLYRDSAGFKQYSPVSTVYYIVT